MVNESITKRTKQNNKIDVLIVGAGLSGLISAFKITQTEPSLQVRILETSNRVGGQLNQVSLGEIGAKWISEDQCHIYRLINSLKVPMYKRNSLSSHLKSYREMNEGIFSVLANYELKRYIHELELKMEFFKPGFVKCKGHSMQQHIHNRLFFNSSRKYMLNLVLVICGTEAKYISFKDFMSICYTSGGIRRLIDLIIEVPNYSLIEFSSKDLLYKLLQHLQNIEILYERKVIAINQYRDFVEVRDSSNEYHVAEAIILAIPWNFSQEIYFRPPLPLELQTPPSPVDSEKYIVTSFLASYTEGYWRLKGFSGCYIKHEPLLIAQEYRPTVYAGFMIHEEGIEPLVKSIVLHEFAKIFGEEMLVPREFQQHSYELNYLGHLPLTTPWNRIIWSSSAASGTCYRGRLGGAVQSGLRAAVNALLVCRPQIVTWQDIAEVQCHSYLRRRETTWSSVFLSTFNLYNVSTYTIFISGLVLILTKAYKKH
ncbi:amine oxidase [flavin-containing] B [Lucilia cuprina]|uniref:amine oxidase [flavin-containing] B n=1 Tax=Lucilia cuprina TaxID=7375 RepID=UPI001F05A81E|nr:amine oxidase [flavin-containing] B [Lucilia cuprina]